MKYKFIKMKVTLDEPFINDKFSLHLKVYEKYKLHYLGYSLLSLFHDYKVKYPYRFAFECNNSIYRFKDHFKNIKKNVKNEVLTKVSLEDLELKKGDSFTFITELLSFIPIKIEVLGFEEKNLKKPLNPADYMVVKELNSYPIIQHVFNTLLNEFDISQKSNEITESIEEFINATVEDSHDNLTSLNETLQFNIAETAKYYKSLWGKSKIDDIDNPIKEKKTSKKVTLTKEEIEELDEMEQKKYKGVKLYTFTVSHNQMKNLFWRKFQIFSDDNIRNLSLAINNFFDFHVKETMNVFLKNKKIHKVIVSPATEDLHVLDNDKKITLLFDKANQMCLYIYKYQEEKPFSLKLESITGIDDLTIDNLNDYPKLIESKGRIPEAIDDEEFFYKVQGALSFDFDFILYNEDDDEIEIDDMDLMFGDKKIQEKYKKYRFYFKD